MSIFTGGWRLFADNKGPWGNFGGRGKKPGSTPTGGPSEDGNGGPWQSGPTSRPGPRGNQNVSSLDDWIKRRRGGGSGSGSGGQGPRLQGLPNPSFLLWGLLAFVLIVLLFSSVHQIGPQERGVVTRAGRYVATLGPGVNFTMPAPIDKVRIVDVEDIRGIDLGTEQSETLMLTGDENIIDIEYQVRFNIADPRQYIFQLENPDDTVREVAESTMREIVAQSTLQDAIGDGRGEIEAAVRQQMQAVLNEYRAGVDIRGVEIKRADPPAAVNDAFKEVTAAKQDAESYINKARAYAVQVTENAQGESQAFDKVYEEYRLAPEVTRRRMYYETMEQVLSGVDKTIVETPGVTPYLPLDRVNRPRQEPAQ